MRINYDNIFILFTDRDGCTYDDLVRFEKLPFKNKIAFTHKKYLELKHAFYISGFENQESVGALMNWVSRFSPFKYYDRFDYVSWFNGEKEK